MAVEKGLFQAPKGVEEEKTEQLEIEIVNPDMVTLDDGSMEVTIVPDAEGVSTGAFDENIAENMEEELWLMSYWAISTLIWKAVKNGQIPSSVVWTCWVSSMKNVANPGKELVVCTLTC